MPRSIKRLPDEQVWFEYQRNCKGYRKILGKDLHVTEEDIAKLTIEPVKEIIKDVRLDAM